MSKVVHTSGKRKTAIARGTVKEGTGRIRVNRKPVELYSPELPRLKIQEPLELAGDIADSVDITIRVVGGGVMAQAEAARWLLLKVWLNIPVMLNSKINMFNMIGQCWLEIHVDQSLKNTADKCKS